MINLKDISIGSKIIQDGNVLVVQEITQKHTYKGALFAKTAVCSCSIKTERGVKVCEFVPFVLHDDRYVASSEYSLPKNDLAND
jgi:hypothetical protein